VGVKRIGRSKGFAHSHSVSSQIMLQLLLLRHDLLVILEHCLHQFCLFSVHGCCMKYRDYMALNEVVKRATASGVLEAITLYRNA
jgi:hypothetical protein